ncbi:hypothetical protein [Lentimicrobium sp. S6]|uniref:hypothetical protein n=1 Tax=Lentimicrobium sp. S6 TaxID=2735872 RepID=UPI00155735EE|nr:hypothetical protein [Lentimicrobium sp. S6]NPD47486.1 hypothetical protein [Lentimicrobium sp. S6]
MAFSKVTYSDLGFIQPAEVDRVTKELFINSRFWDDIPESFQRFILLHEEGHLIGGENGQSTSNEIEADLYAFRNYKNTEPGSLKKAVFAIDKLLGKTPDQIKRKLIVYAAALLEDWKFNKNEKALVEYFNVKAELQEYYDVELPEVPGDKSGFVQIVAAVIGLAVTGVSMYAKNKARKNALNAEKQYGIEATKANSDLIMQQIYAMDGQKKDKAISDVNMKYLGIISLVITIAFLAWYFIIKKKK